jgi:hypothetical protein
MTYDDARDVFFAVGDARKVDYVSGVLVEGQNLRWDRAEGLATATGAPAATFEEEDGVPVLVEQSFEVGKLVFVAFELQHPPFSRWTAKEAFWKQILKLRSQGMPAPFKTNNQVVLDALMKSMPSGFPDKRLAFGMLVLYVLLFKLAVVPFGRRGSKNWRVLAGIAILMVLFSGISYGLFFYPNQKQRLAYDSVLHMHVSGSNKIALGEYTLGVYGLKGTSYNLGFGDAVYPFRPIVADNLYKQTPAPYVLRHTDTGLRISGELNKWSYNFFTFTTPIDFQMKAEAHHAKNEGLQLVFDNPTPQSLMAAYGYLAGKLFALGPIAAETTVTKSFSQTVVQTQKLFDSGSLQALLEPDRTLGQLPFWRRIQQNLLKHVLMAVHETYNGREDVLVLVGWMPSDVLELNFASSGHVGDSVTLVTWVVPVQ